MSDTRQGSSVSFWRADGRALAAIIVVAVLAAFFVIRAPRIVGLYEDDGIYLTTAKALAEGRGYRHLELPGEPYQTKYPILYPLLLAAVWRLFPSFPDNVPVIQVVNTALWAASAWITYRLLRRVWGLPSWLAALGVILGFANAATLGVIQTAMAEPLYVLLTMAALAVWCNATAEGERTATTRRALVPPAAAGLLAAGAYLTRSIGVTLIIALVVDGLLRRRWMRTAVAGVVALLGAAGWHVWRAWASAANAADPMTTAFGYDLDYSIWIAPSLRAAAWVAYHNLSEVIMEYFLLLGALPGDWAKAMLEKGIVRALPLYLGALLALALTLLGLRMVTQARRLTIPLYLLCYFGVVLVWPFAPWRFLLPVFALLITLLLAGCYGVVLWLVRLKAGAATQPGDAWGGVWSENMRGADWAFRATFLLAAAIAYPSWRLIVQPDRATLDQTTRERDALAEYLRTNTPADAVVCTTKAAYLHLRTGRKFVPFLPYENPVAHRYSAERRFAECGRVIPRAELAADLRFMQARLIDYLTTTGASYIVPLPPSTKFGHAFAAFRQLEPGRFRRVGVSGPYSIYQFAGSAK